MDCQINIQCVLVHVPRTDLHVPRTDLHVPSTNVYVTSMLAAASVQNVALYCHYTDYTIAIDLFSASLA